MVYLQTRRRIFPNDTSAFKVVLLAIQKASKRQLSYTELFTESFRFRRLTFSAFPAVFAAVSLLSSFSSRVLSGAFRTNNYFWSRLPPVFMVCNRKLCLEPPPNTPADRRGIYVLPCRSYFFWTTFAAAGPFGPSTMSKVTSAPSVRVLNPCA
ncbi:hypothetical protein SAMN05660330_01423 [Desulforhopalus singaporensis]|uniref:Uncharacterized protein n=1 Tax=Desulforhopalus singaporensis TaxID=91360 RepID=A0A1H0NS61_9BACT|nr:hypothetical protein SAMN05660330_01423 [Desulforhopalus singaporensis]